MLDEYLLYAYHFDPRGQAKPLESLEDIDAMLAAETRPVFPNRCSTSGSMQENGVVLNATA